ncbi:MAG: hypothetical protein Q7S58_00095 [Candidatus Binatus sp.]|uniref:hypothetical protein n=1 Tax=Candidatus Binatus sp. TaxID=2811406 RepID=UPI00271A9395|nr:hypothetical protein [Candidatus Binatus sp.]MDO8430785.1 hypothetical protein [Candidatus Binatus sp.]
MSIHSLIPNEPWRQRCYQCHEWRVVPHLAYSDYKDGAEIPTPIYDWLMDTEYGDIIRADGLECVEDSADNDDNQESLELYQAPEPTSLAVAEPSWMNELPDRIVTPDIQQLVEEAFSPFEDRRRSFWEWLTEFDVRGAQMAQKLAAAGNAQALLRVRKDMVADMTALFQSVTDLRSGQLEAFLNELTLREQIAEKLALASTRLGTLKAIETSRRQKLLEAPPEAVSRSQQVVGEHREELQARAAAQRAALADFRSEVADIIDEDIDDGQKAHELRALLESYRLPENALPKRIRQFLADVDGEDEP